MPGSMYYHSRVSPLHTDLQVSVFQRCKREFACPVPELSSRVWRTLLPACDLYTWLCFCVLYSTVQHKVGQSLNFKPRMSSMTRKKELLPRQHHIFFFKRVDRTESSKSPGPVPSTLGTSETAACPPSPIADDPSALPSPAFSPSSSQ